MKNEKGVIILAVILSMLLVISALAVFGVVSGRFGISYHLNNRIQALRDAETASFVTYQMMRDDNTAIGPAASWDTPAEVDAANAGDDLNHKVTINGRVVDITVYDDPANKLSAKVKY